MKRRNAAGYVSMKYSVYVLRSKKDGKLYVGFTHDINKRVSEHNLGKVDVTKKRRPFDLVYCELFKNEYDARKREYYYKSGWGRRHLMKTLHHTLQKIEAK